VPAAPQRLFGVPLHTLLLNDFESRRAALVEELLELKARSPGIARSNRGAWHSTPDLFESAAPELARIRDELLQGFSAQLAPPGLALRWHELWAIVSGPGDWLAPHHHHPAVWSGVLYVDAERHVVAGDRAGKLELLSPAPLTEALGEPSGVVLSPRDGVALAFPATLMHFVHPQRLPGPRVALSFNFVVGT
jgi:uncharacterized protein (TIGR02466 family)